MVDFLQPNSAAMTGTSNPADAPAAAATKPHVLAGLPIQVIEDILWYAAHKDYKTAHALAFVSKSVCKLTAEARWRVIAITSLHQAFALQRTLVFSRNSHWWGEALDVLATRDYLDEGGLAYNCLDERSCISDGVIHLKIKRPGVTRSGGEVLESVELKMPWGKDRRGMSISLPPGQPEHYIEHLLIDIQEDAGASSSLDDLTKALRCDYFLLDWWPFQNGEAGEYDLYLLNLKCFSIGAADAEHMSEPWVRLPTCGVKELTMEYRYDESSSFSEDWAWLILTHPLDRLHIMSIGGGEPPWNDLERFRAGTIRPIEWEASTAEWVPSVGYRKTPHRGVTYLRFDAPQRAFEPAATTAQRLRRFLHEVCFVREEAEEWNERLTRPYSVWEYWGLKVDVLKEWGFGQFRRLHLAWGEGGDAELARELQRAFEEVYGWHGCNGPEDAAVPGEDALQYDLLDPRRDKARFKTNILKGYTSDDEHALELLDAKLFNEAEDRVWERVEELGEPYYDNSMGKEVEYAIRAPSTVLQFGPGAGAFTKRQRLELFLDRAYGGEGAWATK